MFLLEGEESVYMEDFCTLISYVSSTCEELLSVQTHDLYEEAVVCLSVLVGYNVTLRNEQNMLTAINRAVAILPDLDNDKLKAHLLVHLYGETEDESYAREAHTLFAQFPDSSLTQEDRWALQALDDIARQFKLSHELSG